MQVQLSNKAQKGPPMQIAWMIHLDKLYKQTCDTTSISGSVFHSPPTHGMDFEGMPVVGLTRRLIFHSLNINDTSFNMMQPTHR